MKKKMMAIAVSAVMVLGLAACGGSDSGSTSGSSSAGNTSAADEVTMADFAGVWEYDDYYLWLEIAEDGTATIYPASGDYRAYECSLDGDSLVLEDYISLSFVDDVLTDSDGDTLFASELPAEYDYYGVWEYDDYYLAFEIKPNGGYVIYTGEDFAQDEDYAEEDCVWQYVEEDGSLMLISPTDDSKYIYILTMDAEDRNVCVDDEDSTLFRSALPETTDESEE